MEEEVFSLQTAAYIVCNTSFVLCNMQGLARTGDSLENVQNCRKLRKTTRRIKGLENFQN